MKITILCAGKIKERYLNDGIAEYSKRLSRYCTLDIEAVQDEKTPENASQAENEQIKITEGRRMMEYLNKNKGNDTYVCSLAIKGKEYDSVGFSKHLSELMLQGKSHIIFIIGGSLGISDEVLNASDMKLSFSKFTFPHQLMRLIFLEQLYRAFKIRQGEPYHK
jgi:23S rRNA (pseudouridine1915-N3)-methyltransferase